MSETTGPAGEATASHRILGGRISTATSSELYDHWVHGCGRVTASEVDGALVDAIAELSAARAALQREREDLDSVERLDPRDAMGGAQ